MRQVNASLMAIDSDDLSIADALVEGRRFRPWLDAQFLLQRTLTGLVLGQGSAPLVVQGQKAHQLAVGLLLPGR